MDRGNRHPYARERRELFLTTLRPYDVGGEKRGIELPL